MKGEVWKEQFRNVDVAQGHETAPQLTFLAKFVVSIKRGPSLTSTRAALSEQKSRPCKTLRVNNLKRGMEGSCILFLHTVAFLAYLLTIRYIWHKKKGVCVRACVCLFMSMWQINKQSLPSPPPFHTHIYMRCRSPEKGLYLYLVHTDSVIQRVTVWSAVSRVPCPVVARRLPSEGPESFRPLPPVAAAVQVIVGMDQVQAGERVVHCHVRSYGAALTVYGHPHTMCSLKRKPALSFDTSSASWADPRQCFIQKNLYSYLAL